MKLHLGCGKRYIKGFVHIDLREMDHIDYCSPVENLDFLDDESVELIYASHVLEHFGRDEYEKVLDEWYRVLKPEGVLRVAVPNFDAVVQFYTEKSDDMNLILGQLVGGQKNGEFDFHNMVFSEKSLTESLLNTGFSKVLPYDWRDTEHADVDDFSQSYLPHMDKENGFLLSLNLEAFK